MTANQTARAVTTAGIVYLMWITLIPWVGEEWILPITIMLQVVFLGVLAYVFICTAEYRSKYPSAVRARVQANIAALRARKEKEGQ